MALQGTDFFNIVRGVSQAAVQGTERGRRNALADQQLVEREQVKNALAEFTMPDAPQEQRDAALNTLLTLDPQTANDAQTFDVMRAERENTELVENAREGIAQTDFIRDSEDPVVALELLDEDGALRATALELGLDATDRDDVVTLSRLFESQYTQFIEASENELQRKLNTVRANLPDDPLTGEPGALTAEQVVALSGGGSGTTINVGADAELDEFIPFSQLPNFTGPNGEAATPDMSRRDLIEGGFTVSTQADRTAGEKVEAANAVLDELEDISFGTADASGNRSGGGVFADSEPGLFNRVTGMINAGFDMVTQNDPGATRFNDLATGTLSPLAKAMGEAGALAEGDVLRVQGLLPKLFPLKDTTEIAQGKFEALRRIFNRGNENKRLIADGQRPDLSPVLTDEEWAELEELGEQNTPTPAGADVATTAASFVDVAETFVTDLADDVVAFTTTLGEMGVEQLNTLDLDEMNVEQMAALADRLSALGR